ncbi:MAG: hypothetical protein AAFV96_01020 [Pseudomonadota bacterium]
MIASAARYLLGVLRRMKVVIFLLLSVLAATGFVTAERTLREAAVPATALQTLSIAPGVEDVLVGRRELGQRPGAQSAELKHLRAVHDPVAGWKVGNVAASRRLLLLYGHDRPDQFARRWILAEGDTIRLGATVMQVESLTPGRLSLAVNSGTTARRLVLTHRRGQAPRLSPDGAAPLWLDDQACGIEPTIFQRARRSLAAFDAFNDRERRLATIGGGVDCADRIATLGVPRALELLYQKGAGGQPMLSLAPLGPDGLSARFARRGQSGFTSFAQLLWPLDGVTGMILGRTLYRVQHAPGQTLDLSPIRNTALFLQEGDTPVCDDEARENPRSMCAIQQTRAETGDGIAMVLRPASPVPLGAWSLEERGAWLLTLGAASLAVGLGFALIAYRFLGVLGRERVWILRLHRGHKGLTALLLGLSIAVTLFYLLIGPLSSDTPRALLTYCLLTSWTIATLAFARLPEGGRRIWLFWLAMSGLMALGALSAEQLSLGAANTRWHGFDMKHVRSLMATVLAVTVVLSLDLDGVRSLAYTVVHGRGFGAALLRALPVLVLSAAFGLWLLFGREEGLGDFQPIEAGKFLGVVFLAVLATRLYQERLFAAALAKRVQLILGLAAFAAFYGLMFGIIPGLKGDYSPVLILGVVGCLMLVTVGAFLRAHRFAQIRLKAGLGGPPGALTRRRSWLRRPWLESLALVTGAVLLGGGALLAAEVIASVGQTVATPAAAGFSIPEERIAVYLAPELHPDLGSQLIQSIRLIGETPCYDAALCRDAVPRFGPNPAEAMRLPAVQDDFALSFYINRFGSPATVLLGLLQVAVLYFMIDSSVRAYRWAGGDYADDAMRQTLAFITIGGALMLAAHWGIAWGNAFGAIPVMGQP